MIEVYTGLQLIVPGYRSAVLSGPGIDIFRHKVIVLKVQRSSYPGRGIGNLGEAGQFVAPASLFS